MTFGQKLQQLRVQVGLGEDWLACLSDLPAGSIQKLEAGECPPSLATVARIAQALLIPCETFAECEDLIGLRFERPRSRKAKRA
jgi:predicted transcriptional regulator